ncbi:MAG: tetratricopeptide repeat protein [Chlorobiaceae bacterium]|nr:tetratricopeptide repeat protein [Chlorobiaceae bacterium]
MPQPLSDNTTRSPAQEQEKVQRALAFHQQGKIAQAQALYEEVLAMTPDHADALHLSGVAAAQSNNLLKAIDLIGKAIELSPNNATYYYNRGKSFQELKKFDDAIACYDNAIAIMADYAEAYSNRGLALHALKQFDDALASFNRAIALKPDFAEAFNNRGNALRELRQTQAAVESYEQAIALKPDFAEAFHNRGIAFRELKQAEAALASFDLAIALRPDYAEAYQNRGNALQELRKFNDALSSYDKAIAIRPDYAEAYCNRGFALQELMQHENALACYDKAIAIMPGYTEAYNNRGCTLLDQKEYDAALASLDKAIELAPDYAQAHYNRGVVLHNIKRLDDALACYNRAIALKPDYAEAYSNRGYVLQQFMRLDDAVADYNRAIALRPDYDAALWNKSIALLLRGDFEHGLPLYEKRWRTELKDSCRNFPQPLWSGTESLRGKTILLHSEQGLGDTIQFCRYARSVADLGARVIMEVDPSLAGLLKELPGISGLVIKGNPLPDFDCHCPLLSLPLAFKTDLQSIPCSSRYLKTDTGKAAYWKTRLGQTATPLVGLAWSGSPTHSNDKNRSIPLSTILDQLPSGYRYVSLQKEIRESDKQTLEAHTGIIHVGDELNDFTDTAALCDLMDLVISVDTSVVHLSGALGKPTWVLVPFVPDWRWMIDRDDSPWYPGMRLFRQQRPEDWISVLEKVKSGLLAAYAG